MLDWIYNDGCMMAVSCGRLYAIRFSGKRNCRFLVAVDGATIHECDSLDDAMAAAEDHLSIVSLEAVARAEAVAEMKRMCLK